MRAVSFLLIDTLPLRKRHWEATEKEDEWPLRASMDNLECSTRFLPFPGTKLCSAVVRPMG